MTHFKLSEFLDTLSATYKQGFKAENIGECLYKIHDDSVRPKHFLGTDNEDEIEAILSDHKGHSLHEYINGDESLWSIIDFNLSVETLNAISLKLSGKQAKNLLYCAFRDSHQEIFLGVI
ncbi:hypothetical protein C1646_765939 [Rhizophagus diaphanus]|nr:hypothetical protein C1646_765939 [Rhizophagus diaphanus] [Rhizophagus sp. MUCL 43196]